MTWQEFILSALIACVEVDALVVRGDIRLRFACVDVGVVDIVLWLGSRVGEKVSARDIIDFARNFFRKFPAF